MKPKEWFSPPLIAMSPPARGRGLKPLIAQAMLSCMASPPARGRGLKQLGRQLPE